MWIVDEEQTDNVQSPWDVLSSSSHGLWRSKNPKLAALVNPRARRGHIVPNPLEEAPESMAVNADSADVRDTITRSFKRLLSNESSAFFFYPVPTHEADYHSMIDNPTCLQYIIQRAERDEYPSFFAFSEEVCLMLSNAFRANGQHSSGWILACIMQRDWDDHKAEMINANQGWMLESAPGSSAHE